MDNNQIYALIKQVEDNLTTRIGRVDDEVNQLRLLVAEDRGYNRAHDLPAKIKAVNARIDASNARILNLEQAGKDDQALKRGRRSVWDYVVAVIAVTGLIVSIVKDLIGK